MTAYKKYIKSKGIRLESDMPFMPYGIIESITSYIDLIARTAVIAVIDDCLGRVDIVIRRDGSMYDRYYD